MSSILTNTSALTALQSLAATQKALTQTQNQISTGLKVSSAADNAAYWSIATQMKSDNMALGAVSDSLGQSNAVLSVATASLGQSLDVLNKMKTDLVSAKNPGSDLTKINTDLAQLGSQLTGIYQGASMNGQNYLDGSITGAVTIVSGFHQGGGGATIDTISITPQALSPSGAAAAYTVTGPDITSQATINNIQGLTDNHASATLAFGQDVVTVTQATTGTWATGDTALVSSKAADGTQTDTTYTWDATNNKFTQSALVTPAAGAGAGLLVQSNIDITQMGSGGGNNVTAANASALVLAVDNAIKAVTDYSSKLGAVQSRISAQQDFVSKLSDALTNGVSTLVDADMNKASTRLQALQVQQQLGVQSLSIANQNTQMILKLFGG